MPKGTRELRRRIKSITSTKKITRAMQMVAAAKMRKAVQAVVATRDYANMAWATVLDLAKRTDAGLHPLLRHANGDTKRVGLILVSSNRGLCGGFNLQIVQKAINSIRKHEAKVTLKNTEIITLGTRGRDIVRGFGYSVVADFEKKDITLSVADISALAKTVCKDFVAGKYDKVFVAFTDFQSSVSQMPRVKQLLPIEPAPEEFLGVVGASTGIETTAEFIASKRERHLQKENFSFEFIFEPTPAEVLKELLPRLIEMQVYQAVLESEASEHSARMLAMKNATDAAGDMIDDLTLSFNRARQAGITQEIAEIASGAAALQ